MAKFYAKAPDGSDALLSIVLTGFTQSLQQNGWCKLPNSLIFQWKWYTLINTFEWNTIEPPISMKDVYTYLGIHANSSPTVGYFPIRGSDTAITFSLIDPDSNPVTHADHAFKCFMIGK